MKKETGIRSAHGDTVNSVFVNFNAGVVISVDDNSIRIWDPVNGTEIYQTDMDETEDSVIPGLGSMYKMEPVTQFDS